MIVSTLPKIGVSDPSQPPGEDSAVYRAMLRLILSGTAADGAFLAWTDSATPIIEATDEAQAGALELGEIPDPPRIGFVLSHPDSPRWAEWCESQGLGACVVTPILNGQVAIGSIGLFRGSRGDLGASELDRVSLAGALAAQARADRSRVASARKVLEELRAILEPDLAGEPILQGRLTYGRLANALGRSLDATYCRIGIRDRPGRLTVHASAGRRVPSGGSRREWPLTVLTECQRAIETGQPIVLTFERPTPAAPVEREALFSQTTRTGIIVPFAATPTLDGVLLVGEERGADRQPLLPEMIAALEVVGHRLGEILQLRIVLEQGRIAESQRQRRLAQMSERRRLSRELHDEVGQALSTLLLRIRVGIAQGQLSTADMELFEEVAQTALDASRAVAYNFRRTASPVDPIRDARRFAETMLQGADCRLTWVDTRNHRSLASGTAREVGRVIKESVTNIVRHAQAGAVAIRLESPNGKLRVVIEDDGVGYAPGERDRRPNGGGVGLLGNAERLAQLKGVFTIRRAPGAGTIVTIEAPRR